MASSKSERDSPLHRFLHSNPLFPSQSLTISHNPSNLRILSILTSYEDMDLSAPLSNSLQDHSTRGLAQREPKEDLSMQGMVSGVPCIYTVVVFPRYPQRPREDGAQTQLYSPRERCGGDSEIPALY